MFVFLKCVTCPRRPLPFTPTVVLLWPSSGISFLLFPWFRSPCLTVVLNSTLLHKSPPLSLAACCGRFYNPLLRQCWGLFHYLTRFQCWGTKHTTCVCGSSRWLCVCVWGGLLSLSAVSHASLAVSFHFMSFPFSQQTCISPCPSPLPSLWLSCLCYLTDSPLFLFFPDWPTGRSVYSAALQQLSPSFPAVVYVTEARAVKGWSPDKEKD